MKLSWLAYYLLAISTFAGAQEATDLTKINQLLQKSRSYQWKDSYLSLIYADSALVRSQSGNFNKGIASAKVLKAFAHWSFGDNDLAIQSAMEALELAEAEKDQAIEAECYYILARGYMDLREQEQSIEAIRKAERLAIKTEQWELLSSIYNLRGVVLFMNEQTDSALYFYQQAYDLAKHQNIDPINYPRIISNMGECYAAENLELAFSYYSKALALAKETGNRIAEASITDIIGHAYFRKKDLKKSEEFLLHALELAQELGLRRVIRHSYGGLVDIKLQQGKGDEAVVYLRKYYAVRDSLINTSKIRQIVELESRHALQLQERNIELLEKEKRIQILWRNILIGLVIIIILFSIAIYQWQKYRYRKNRELLNLEIDYLTRQHLETVDKLKATLAPEDGKGIESLDQRLLKKAIALVEEHLNDPQFGVERMAEEMNMSRTNLHRKIKNITGFPPSELIRSIRLRKAARLIVNRVDTVSQIALMVGFDDYSHFSKAFKKHFGVAPSAYEEQAQSTQAVE